MRFARKASRTSQSVDDTWLLHYPFPHREDQDQFARSPRVSVNLGGPALRFTRQKAGCAVVGPSRDD